MGRFHVHPDGTAHVGEHGEEHQLASLPDHSRYSTGPERVEVLERILGENDRRAADIRSRLDASGVRAVNLMSSPGAGKTTLLEVTLPALEGEVRIGLVEGDIETSLDADRLRGFGAQISLLNTGRGFGGECHLDAPMVSAALESLDLDGIDLLLVENVGNLVCPAEFDIGAHHSVMVFSVTEGEDKPLKYPVMFRAVELVLLNKIDLLPHLDFDTALFEQNLSRVSPHARVLQLSARTGQGVDTWLDWLRQVAPSGTAE